MRPLLTITVAAVLALVALGGCSPSGGSGGSVASSDGPSASPNTSSGGESTKSPGRYPPCTKEAAKDALAGAGAPVDKIDGEPVCDQGWAAVHYTIDGNKDKASAMLQAKGHHDWEVVKANNESTYCTPGDTTVPERVTQEVCPT